MLEEAFCESVRLFDVGYPIVCNLLCMWYITKKDEQMNNALTRLQSSLDGVTSAVDNLREGIEGNEN